MRSKRLRSLGFALVILGAAVLVAPSLGFESINAERSVTVETAPNENAQLGLDEAYDGTEIQYSTGAWGVPNVEQAQVANVTNDVGTPLSVSVNVASIEWGGGSDAVLEVSNRDAFADPMGSGATRAVELGCSQSIGGTSEDATVVLEVDATGDPVSVEDATVTINDVAFSCEGASGDQPPDDPIPIDDSRIDLMVTDPPTAGGAFTSEVTVPIRNTGTDDVSITGVHLANASSGTSVQGLFGATEVQITGGQQTGTLDTTNGLEIGPEAPQYDLDQDGDVASNEEVSLSIRHFRGDDSFLGTADMSGATVTVVLMVEGLNVNDRNDPVPVEMELQVQS